MFGQRVRREWAGNGQGWRAWFLGRAVFPVGRSVWWGESRVEGRESRARREWRKIGE